MARNYYQHPDDPQRTVSSYEIRRYAFGIAITGTIPLDELMALLQTFVKEGIVHDHKVSEKLNCDLALCKISDLAEWRVLVGCEEEQVSPLEVQH